MNLREWFHQQQRLEPSSLQKMKIYQTFLDKSHRSLRVSKINYYLKVGVFSFVLLVVGSISYLSLQDDGAYQIVQQDGSYTILKPQAGIVQAAPLGQIITAKGDITMVNAQDDTAIETTDLHDGERIVLAKGAEIEVLIGQGVRARIIGEAEFELQDLGKQDGINNYYAINLISGDYFEVHSIDKSEIGNKLGRGEQEEDPLDHIIVSSPRFSLETKHLAGNIDVVASIAENNRWEVANNGSEIVMKTIVEDEQKYIAIAPHQKVAVNGDVNFIDVDIDQLKQEIQDKQLTVRYEIKKDDPKSSIGDAMVEATTIADVLEETKNPSRQVISDNLLQDLDKVLSHTFLDRDLAQIKQYYGEENDAAFAIAYNNLLLKLYAGYEVLGLDVTRVEARAENLLAGASLAENLADMISKTYYIDPSRLVSLYATANSLRALSYQAGTAQANYTDSVSEKEPAPVEVASPKDTEKTIEEQLKEFGIE